MLSALVLKPTCRFTRHDELDDRFICVESSRGKQLAARQPRTTVFPILTLELCYPMVFNSPNELFKKTFSSPTCGTPTDQKGECTMREANVPAVLRGELAAILVTSGRGHMEPPLKKVLFQHRRIPNNDILGRLKPDRVDWTQLFVSDCRGTCGSSVTLVVSRVSRMRQTEKWNLRERRDGDAVGADGHADGMTACRLPAGQAMAWCNLVRQQRFLLTISR